MPKRASTPKSSGDRYYLGSTSAGKPVEIPCPNRKCKQPVCQGDRAECTHSGEDATPVPERLKTILVV
ncbi:MAG: hypothetical protein G01um101449_469, partial [Parcubacteria group bacterium Gr01-1014_49]